MINKKLKRVRGKKKIFSPKNVNTNKIKVDSENNK